MRRVINNCRRRFQLEAPLLISIWVLGMGLSAQAAPLTAGGPILLPNTHGKFDFIRIDTAASRLLLGHEANKTLDVFDLGSRTLLKSVPTGTAQDVAVDPQRSNYYVSANDPGRMVIVSAKTLEVTGQVPLPAATNLIAFNPKTGLVHICNDTAAEQWAVDPQLRKLVTTIKFEGRGVEDLAFDPPYSHLFQAVKAANTIAVVDPADNSLQHAWSLAPDTGPHGIAIVPDSHGLLAACSGKLVLMNRATGKILDRAEIGGRVDEMAYDPESHTAYCASRHGKISVVSVSGEKLTSLGEAPDEPGTGSIVVDPKTHTVWIAFPKGDECYVQPFVPSP